MHFLVTGASGFVGGNLVELLCSRGHEVTCASRNPLNAKKLHGMPVTLISNDDISNSLKNKHHDYVIHIGGATRGINWVQYLNANVEFTRHVLKASLTAQIKRFVFVSSQAAVGPSKSLHEPVDENSVPNPITYYGKSKLLAERIVQNAAAQLPITIIRPSTVFGPGDYDVLPAFKMAKTGIIPVLNHGDSAITMVYVRDLTEGIYAAAQNPAAIGETFMMGNEFPTFWKKFLFEIAKSFGKNPFGLPLPLGIMRLICEFGEIGGRVSGRANLMRREKFEEMKHRYWICSSQKAKTLLNWQAATPLKIAISETGHWYKKNGLL